MPFSEISPIQLMRRLGRADAPTVLDLVLPEDHAEDPHVIPTARRMCFADVPMAAFDDSVVVVCQKGRKVSQGAAAHLRARGIRAEVLTGGMVGWREAGLPAVPSSVLPARGTPWVTRQRPRIDRLAVPWLVRRWIDPSAPILFVPPADVPAVADRWNAVPFDHPEAELCDREGRCSFDAVLERFGLSDPALGAMARVIRAADGHGDAPEAAGLHAISVGLARFHMDDMELMHAALPVFDALYRWARDGRDEEHSHP